MRLREVDRNSPVPLYYQIKEIIKEYIKEKNLKPHDMLPPEEELSKMFKVSRMTVRQAMKELQIEGIIYRLKGKGTFVAEKARISDLAHLKGFSEELEEMGKEHRSIVLFNDLVEPPDPVLEEFKLEKGTKILLLKRIRYEGDIPRAIEEAYLNTIAYPKIEIVTKKDMEKESLYKILRDELSIVPTLARETIEIHEASKDEAKLLEIGKGTCLFKRVRITSSQEDVVFEYTVSLYRPDGFKLSYVVRV